jgi:hypothetical protein
MSQTPDCSTHFLFEHNVFKVKGGRFAFTADGTEPAFHIMLGDLAAALRLPGLRKEFAIDGASSDGRLLSVVEKSLRFVKEIRHGDSIPRELLDGTASWSVSDDHRAIARGRLLGHVIGSSRGKAAAGDANAWRRLAANEGEPAQRAREAAGGIAEALGLGSGGQEEILGRIDLLARELCYIEALRERSGLLRTIAANLNSLAKLYRGDRAVIDDISRVNTLLQRPFADFDRAFDRLDDATAEILTVLGGVAGHVQLIRKTRDDVHVRLMPWDTVIATWTKLDPVRGPAAEVAIEELYRFAARHYMVQEQRPRIV